MKKGFTLAEVLITLGIIGVVASLTLPALIQNHQKRSLEVATKKFYSMLSQAVKQYMADEGVDDLRNTPLSGDNYNDWDDPVGLDVKVNFAKKYLKVVKECNDTENCFAEKYKAWDGGETTYDFVKDGRYPWDKVFVLADGVVLKIGYTGPFNIFVDVNGKKGPNRVGYDFWSMSIFYDGVIDESGVGPENRKGELWDYGTAKDNREHNFEKCKEGTYGGCFGHFLENNFKFDY